MVTFSVNSTRIYKLLNQAHKSDCVFNKYQQKITKFISRQKPRNVFFFPEYLRKRRQYNLEERYTNFENWKNDYKIRKGPKFISENYFES